MATGRRCNQSRGRAALAGAAGIFVVAQLLVGALLDRYGLGVRFPSAARVLATASRTAPDIVFLGSSRFEGLNADEAANWLRRELPRARCPAVHNASVPGGDPIAEDLIMQELIDRGARPRLAIIEISPDTLNQYNQMFALHAHRQIRWQELPTYLLDVCRAGELKMLVKARFVPLYAHRTRLCQQCGLAFGRLFEAAQAAPPPTSSLPSQVLSAPQTLSLETLLQVPIPPLGPADVQNCQALVPATAKRFRNYCPGGTTAASLERLLERCRSRQIDVILIGAPNSSFYRQNFTPEIAAAYRKYISRLTATYDCRFYDYADRVPDQLFQDPVHLNPLGSYFFTRHLAHDVLSPYWHSREPDCFEAITNIARRSDRQR